MPSDEAGLGEGATRVLFDFIKGNDFRSLHADGFIGGVTPSGGLHFAVYAERNAIPRRLAYIPKPDGMLGDLVAEETVSRGAVVREMSADIFMSHSVAGELMTWLGDRLKELDERAEYVKKMGI